jgi:hypothetical protein
MSTTIAHHGMADGQIDNVQGFFAEPTLMFADSNKI